MSETLITGITLIILLIGLLGTVVPVLPGILLMWGAVVGYGLFLGFGPVGVGALVAATLISVAAVALGFILPARLADESGASAKSQLAAIVGGIIGFFVIPVIGFIIGALAGIAISEYADKGDVDLARQSTVAVAKGFGVSALAQIVAGFLILTVWSLWAATVVL